MLKSKFFVLFLIAAAFLMAAATYAITATYTSAGYDPSEDVGEYGEGKVVPPGWCLEHGYFGEEHPGCRLCD